jgi:hypothetical protein
MTKTHSDTQGRLMVNYRPFTSKEKGRRLNDTIKRKSLMFPWKVNPSK